GRWRSALFVTKLDEHSPKREPADHKFARLPISLQLGEEVAHPLDRAINFLRRRCVGETNVLLCPKALARNCHHTHLAQQTSGNIGRGTDAAASEETVDIRINVKRAFGMSTANAGNRFQALQHVVPKLNVFPAKFLHTILWTFKRRYRCLLRYRIRV